MKNAENTLMKLEEVLIVSETPTKPSTTKDGREFTQSEIITLPDINIPINLDINVNIDPEMKTLLKNVFGMFEAQKRVCNPIPDIPEKIIADPGDLPDDEPTELSVNIPEELTEPEKYGTMIPASQIKWNKVPKYPLFDWREEGNTLILRYANLSHDTNWKTISYLLGFTGSKRTHEIEKVVGSKTSKKISAFSIFCRLVHEGVIKLPIDPDKELDDFLSQYRDEEDPEAVFKPMVTPFFGTRPDDNSGKIEGTLEV